MQQVSIQQAAANALAGYLSTQLTSPQLQALSDVQVNTRWPAAGKRLAKRTVSALIAGEMQKDRCDNVVVAQAPIAGQTVKQTFTIAQFQCRLPMQLDIWAGSDVQRDDLVARCDDLLNQGTSQLPGVFNADPFGEGVVLLLGSAQVGGTQQTQWAGTVLFWFESFVPADDPDSAQRSEYRSTARGEAQFVYTSSRVIDQLLTPILKLKAHEVGAAGSPPSNWLYDIYTVTNIGKGFVYSTGP